MRFVWILLSYGVCICLAAPSAADETDGTRPLEPREIQNRCGLNCAYVALRALGREADLDALEACAGRAGASDEVGMPARTLQELLRSNRLSVFAASLTPCEIRKAGLPAIILLRKPEQESDPGHYIFTFHTRDKEWMAVDPAHPIRSAVLLEKAAGPLRFTALLLSLKDGTPPLPGRTIPFLILLSVAGFLMAWVLLDSVFRNPG